MARRWERLGRYPSHPVLEVNPLVTFKVLLRCAMLGRAGKGLILATTTFTVEARKEATRDGAPPIELVDGEKLVTMFERAGVGLKRRTTYDVDLAFFEEFRK